MKHIEIFDIIIILLKRKNMIIIPTFIICIAAVIYIMLAPQFWVSTTAFLPAKQASGVLPQIGSEFLATGMSLMGQQIQVESLDMLTIMNSRTFSEHIIEKFNLIDYLEIRDEDPRVAMEQALDMLHYSIKTVDMSRETGLITLSIETKEKELSAEIANYYVQHLARYNREERVTKAKLNREYLEQQVEEINTRIESITSQINIFQREHNVINLTVQSQKILEIYAELIAEHNALEIELKYQKEILKPDAPILRQLEIKDEIMRQKIAELEQLQKRETGQFVLALKDIPDLSMQYLNLEFALTIEKKLLEFLYPRYEEAKVYEIRDMPTLEVIDAAVPAGKRSKPKRARFCIIVFLISIVTFSLAAVAVEKVKQIDNEQNKERIDELKKYLRFSRKE